MCLHDRVHGQCPASSDSRWTPMMRDKCAAGAKLSTFQGVSQLVWLQSRVSRACLRCVAQRRAPMGTRNLSSTPDHAQRDKVTQCVGHWIPHTSGKCKVTGMIRQQSVSVCVSSYGSRSINNLWIQLRRKADPLLLSSVRWGDEIWLGNTPGQRRGL